MTFIEKFEQIKKKFAKADPSKLSESFAIQVNLTDDDCGGIFYIAYINNVFSVEPYDYHDNTAIITASSEDLIKVIDGKLDAVKAVITSKIKIDGNVEHVKELVKLKPAKKAAAKKPAAKKSAAKKETTKKVTVKKDVTKKPEIKPADINKVEVKEIKKSEEKPSKK